MKKNIILTVMVSLIAFAVGALAGPAAGRVIGWGRNAGGDLFGTNIGGDDFTIPSHGDSIEYVSLGGHQLTNVVSVAALGMHALALKSDGTLVAWGWDEYNMKLVTVPPGLSNVTAISLAGDHNLALKADGTVVIWGYDTNSPWYDRRAVMPAGVSNVVQIAGGGSTLALKRDGTVAWWGFLPYGVPPAGLSNIVAIAASHSQFGDNLALRKDGTVVTWPSYYVRYDDPYTMPPGLTNVDAIASGDAHALALKKDGTVVSWGFPRFDYMNPNYGQMDVPAGLSNVVAVAGGPSISLALKKDGTVVVWGDNHHHQIDLAAGLSNIVAIAAGQDFCLAIQTPNGTLVETNFPPTPSKP